MNHAWCRRLIPTPYPKRSTCSIQQHIHESRSHTLNTDAPGTKLVPGLIVALVQPLSVWATVVRFPHLQVMEFREQRFWCGFLPPSLVQRSSTPLSLSRALSHFLCLCLSFSFSVSLSLYLAAYVFLFLALSLSFPSSLSLSLSLADVPSSHA